MKAWTTLSGSTHRIARHQLAQTLVLLLALLIVGCQTPGKVPQNGQISEDIALLTETPSDSLIRFDKLMVPGDRILFLGDELTQQMYYTRMVAAAILPLRPEDNLRFFNGGYEGATAAMGIQRFDTAIELSRPSVVFVCLGANEARAIYAGQLDRTTYRRNLTSFVQQLQATSGIREIIILSAPAIQLGMGGENSASAPLHLEPGTENEILYNLSSEAEAVAREQGVNFVDLFEHTLAVYRAQMALGGESLTVNGRMPTDVGHVVIASIVLRGIGLTDTQVARTYWSPVTPRKMGRVRQALALRVARPSVEQADKSRAVFMSLQPYDEAFFRAWRIAGRSPSTPSVENAMDAAEHAWESVRAKVEAYREP